MVDSVIAGTGNSRYLRTSLSASTTWEEALTMLRAGTFPIDLAGINLAGFTTLGTALNSATLLKSAVITALGLSADATPSDAWEAVIALISEKADADSTVTSVAYNSSTHKLTVTIDGVTTDVVTITPPPVNSVNTKTGDVVLGSGDIAYSDSDTYPSGSVGAEVADLKSAIGENGANILSAYPTDTASGAIASLSDGADDIPVKALTVSIRPAQSGSGDPAPDNVRPISGWTQAKVTRTGVNVWDEDWELGRLDYDKNSQTWGQNVNTTEQIRSKNYISVIPGQNYYCKAFTGTAVYAIYYGADKSPVPTISNQGFQAVANVSFQVPSNAHYIRFYVPSTTVYGNNISINYPSTDHDYHAYTGTTVTIDLDGTVYGGTLDVLTGVLTVEYVKKSVTSFDGVWGAQPFGYGVYTAFSDTDHERTKIDSAKMVSNIFTYSSVGRDRTPLYGYGGSDGASSTQTFILPDTITSLAEANAWLANNPTECTFKLATPTTYQLTPMEVSTLLGANNIWADTGYVSVNYRADTTLYIDKLTGSTEEDMIADAPIASGKYFLVGNRLFLATAAIAAGAQLTIGTNCTETNLAAALNALNS